MRILDEFNNDGGVLSDWSLQICSTPTLSLDENDLESDVKILNLGNDLFEVVITSDILFEDLDLNVYNMLGQNLLWKTLKKESGSYRYKLNMSHASSGIYLIRIGNNSSGISKRIVVE
ncbi:MAG: T9SS type A sorting domain-containing protein [Flavobacteriaceae bacterium]|nr:MAG: T9SS type A sorting domain-containing protein [Flavobacteriaceae bacterium]